MALRANDAVITLMLVVTVTVWGSAFSGIKVLVTHLDPFDAVVFRFLFAGAAFMALWIWQRKAWKPKRPMAARGAMRMFVLGILGVVIYHGALNAGEAMIARSASSDVAASVTGLLIATTPIFTLLVAIPVLHERVTPRRLLGVLIAFAGVAVLVLWGRGVPMAPEAIRGALVILVAPLSWAFYSIIAKKELRRMGALPLTTYSMLAGALLMLPMGSTTLAGSVPDLPPEVWWWAIFLGLFATFGGYIAWNVALTHWDTTRVSTFVYLVPVSGVLWAVVLLGERFTPVLALGGAAVLMGVWLASGPTRLRAPVGPSSAPQPNRPES